MKIAIEGNPDCGGTKSLGQLHEPNEAQRQRLLNQKLLIEAKARGQRVVFVAGFVFWYEETGAPGGTVKTVSVDSASKSGETLWHEGTIISKNHSRIVVLPYIKENGQKVQSHTKNSSHEKKALPRHPDEYVEVPFEVLRGDRMIELFGGLPYE